MTTRNPWTQFGWRQVLIAVLVGWFVPVAALQAAAIIAMFSLWVWRFHGRRQAGWLLGIAVSLATSAGLRLLLGLSLFIETT